MAIRSSGTSGIPFGGTAGRPANPGNGQPYFNGDVGRLELYTTSTGWQNIVQETPGVASASGHYYQSDGRGTFIISGTNFVSGAIAYAIGTNGVEYQATTTTYDSLVQLTVLFENLSASYEPYDIKVTNPSNLFGLLPDAFYINESPIWSTASGSLGSYIYNQSVSIQLSATDAESNSLTYAVASGSLPTGLSLSTSGLISGTNTSSASTYTFTVSASDGYNAVQTRSFSIATYPLVTGGTLSSDSTYYYRKFTSSGNFVLTGGTISADILVVAGGAAGGGWGGGGGGGGLLQLTSQSVTPNTYTVTVGGGGANTYGSDYHVGGAGGNSRFGALTEAIGGGGGGGFSGAGGPGASGGSGGGGSEGETQGYGGAGTSGQGFAGGIGKITNYTSSGYSGMGGGGGAGGVGGGPQTVTTSGYGSGPWGGGPGGIGATSAFINTVGAATSTGQNVNGVYYYAGGGGGHSPAGWGISGLSANNQPAYNAAGGSGGGGRGGNYPASSNNEAYDGTANTGGGGGGSYGSNVPAGRSAAIGQGGSGIVVVRYTKAAVGG